VKILALWLAVLGVAVGQAPAPVPVSPGHRGQVKFGGLPVPGATVTASQGEKKVTAITDQQGAYSFPNLTAGAWTLQVEMLCFVTIKREVSVATNASSTEEWSLVLLPLEEIQKVAGPAMPPVVAAAAPVPTPAATPNVVPIPKNRKNIPPAPPANPPGGFQRADLKQTAPSVPEEPANNSTDEATPAAAFGAADGFLVNGSVNNGAASPFGQSAAFGNSRNRGRGLYNGSLGMVMDNSILDAQSFSLTGQDTPKPGYNHFQGLLAFGGPVRFPGYHPQRPPNFSVNYQWVRNLNASTQSTSMPTAAMRGGDLSQTLNPLGQPLRFLDPSTGLPFPGNVIPDARISPQAKALLRLYPLPNFNAGARYNYQIPITGITHQDNLQSRINHFISMKNQIFGTFAWQSTRADNHNIFGFLDKTHSSGINTAINWSHRFGMRMFTTFGVQYSRMSTEETPFFANRENVSGLAGITGNNQESLNWGPPRLSFSSGLAALSDGLPSRNRQQTVGLSYSHYWNHGSHNFKFGGDYRRQQFNYLSQQNPRGAFTFNGAATRLTANGVPVPGSGSDFAGFLLGIPDTSSLAFGNADKYFRSSTSDAYINDDWRINASLTLNIGLRWEYGSPITEKYGRLVNLDIAPGYASVAPVVAANPTGTLTRRKYPGSLVHPDRNGIEPRVGLAWRPIPASSLIVRAGYGVTLDTSVYQNIATQMAQQSPLSRSLSVANSLATPLTLANGFITSPTITPNTFAIDPNFRVGYAQSWTVSVQRDLPRGLMMTASYLGIKGTRASQQFLPNTFPAGAVNPCPACPAGYVYLTSNGNSIRNAGSLQLRRRLRNGFTASLQYTWSKSIDNAALGGRGQGPSLIAQNWLDLRAERALSNFDQRHLLNFQAQYSTGVGVGGGTLLSGWRGALFKDWTVTTGLTAGSGLPATPMIVAAVQGTGVTGPLRPQYTGASVDTAPAGLFLNPAAYTTPPSGQWGNAGRNTITGPSQFTLNASLMRTFRMSDRLNADLRVDATNVLNHVVFSSWVTNVSSSQFGLPAAANQMRRLQTSFRVRF